MIGLFGPFSFGGLGNEKAGQMMVIEMMIESGFLTEESMKEMAKNAGEDIESAEFKSLLETFKAAEKVVQLKKTMGKIMLISMMAQLTGSMNNNPDNREETLPHLHVCAECNATWIHTRINIVDYDRAHSCPNKFTDKKCTGEGRLRIPMDQVKPGFKPDFIDWNGQENPNGNNKGDSEMVH